MDEKLATGMMDIFYGGAAHGDETHISLPSKIYVGEYGECGVAIPGKESIYNMQIMEDRQTIWAFGAAAITKAVYPVWVG